MISLDDIFSSMTSIFVRIIVTSCFNGQKLKINHDIMSLEGLKKASRQRRLNMEYYAIYAVFRYNSAYAVLRKPHITV